MAGRKPTPTRLKILKGDKHKDRMNPDEPMPKVALPSPPDFLDAIGRAEWDRMGQMLERLGLLTEIDDAAFANYCYAHQEFIRAETEHQSLGNPLTFVSDKGNTIRHPLINIKNEYATLKHKFLVEFGMTPSSRTRVAVKKKTDEKAASPWKKLKNGG